MTDHIFCKINNLGQKRTAEKMRPWLAISHLTLGQQSQTKRNTPFKSRVRHLFSKALQCYNWPADWARKLFKPSTDSANLLLEIETKFLFCVGILWGNVTSGGVIAFFGRLYTALGANPFSHFWLKFFLETRPKSTSLEPLNGFLAYLEPKIWIKKQKLVKIWGGLHPFSKWPPLASRLS